MEVSGHLHDPAALPLGINPGYTLVRGWVGRKVGLEAVTEKISSLSLSGIELRSFSP
jgi:hypothetical protein